MHLVVGRISAGRLLGSPSLVKVDGLVLFAGYACVRVSVALCTAQIPVLGERLAYPILMVLVHSAPWLLFPCSTSLFFRILCILLADDENGVTLAVQLRSHTYTDNTRSDPIRDGL